MSTFLFVSVLPSPSLLLLLATSYAWISINCIIYLRLGSPFILSVHKLHDCYSHKQTLKFLTEREGLTGLILGGKAELFHVPGAGDGLLLISSQKDYRP
jgi:hypothetical protein